MVTNPTNYLILWLRRQDSNLRPSPYTHPTVSNRGGLYHHPAVAGARRFPERIKFLALGTLFRDSLYAFRAHNVLCATAWLGVPPFSWAGFTDFTSYFNPNYFGRLRNAGLDFAMAICTYENAFIKFRLHFFPRTRDPFICNTELLLLVIDMMEV